MYRPFQENLMWLWLTFTAAVCGVIVSNICSCLRGKALKKKEKPNTGWTAPGHRERQSKQVVNEHSGV